MTTDSSPLQRAFKNARESGNIEDILPCFLAATLFVVSKRIPTQSTPAFFVQRSPNPDRWCVTVSEDADTLKEIDNIELVAWEGKKLFSAIEKGHEVVVVYPDGGDYLTNEQLDYFRSL